VGAGISLIAADRPHHLLVGARRIPPAQRHLRIPLDLGHAGGVQSQSPPMMANTDEAPDVRQSLQTSRLGATRSRGQMTCVVVTPALA
jgi:hypothetical protein